MLFQWKYTVPSLPHEPQRYPTRHPLTRPIPQNLAERTVEPFQPAAQPLCSSSDLPARRGGEPPYRSAPQNAQSELAIQDRPSCRARNSFAQASDHVSRSVKLTADTHRQRLRSPATSKGQAPTRRRPLSQSPKLRLMSCRPRGFGFPMQASTRQIRLMSSAR